MIEPIARIRIELEGTDPSVWRELDVPLSTTLEALHDIIQVVMGWSDCHLFEFVVGDRIYGDPGPVFGIDERRIYKAKGIRLATLIDRGVKEFLYVYDFGDNWQHRVTVRDIRDGDADVEYPRFISGARRAPPEDVGGIGGFEAFLEAIADPEHEDHMQMLDWYGKPFDPQDIDERHVRMIIEDFAARRRGPLMSHRGDARKKPS